MASCPSEKLKNLTQISLIQLLSVFFALALFWLPLALSLGLQWSAFDEYAYGWAVPLLSVWLLFRRLPGQPHLCTLRSATPILLVGFLVALVLFLPIRVLHGANPMWRLTTSLWALLLVALSLLVLWSVGGASYVRRFGPPFAFFLVAVPWPSPIEQTVAQALMGANVSVTVTALDLLGVPAIQKGNVLELATGLVGVEEACSGIRSLQAVLMIGLFFALFYRLTLKRGAFLLFCGAFLAFVFNVIRTTTLSLVAAHSGSSSLARWHDPAGVVIILGCLVAFWALAARLRPEEGGPRVHPASPATGQQSEQPLGIGWSHCRLLLFASVVWVLISEGGTELWYRSRDLKLAPPVTWHLELPSDSTDFAKVSLSSKESRLLRCNSGFNATWLDSSRNRWQLFYLRWEPGRVAGHLAKLHTPEACLPFLGWKLQPVPGIHRLGPLDPPLPFRVFQIQDEGRPTGFVFYCRSGDRRDNETEQDLESTRWQRLRSVLDGRGDQGMTVLEIALWGPASPEEAEQAVVEFLKTAIRVNEAQSSRSKVPSAQSAVHSPRYLGVR